MSMVPRMIRGKTTVRAALEVNPRAPRAVVLEGSADIVGAALKPNGAARFVDPKGRRSLEDSAAVHSAGRSARGAYGRPAAHTGKHGSRLALDVLEREATPTAAAPVITRAPSGMIGGKHALARALERRASSGGDHARA